jgi:hypothetical protein
MMEWRGNLFRKSKVGVIRPQKALKKSERAFKKRRRL